MSLEAWHEVLPPHRQAALAHVRSELEIRKRVTGDLDEALPLGPVGEALAEASAPPEAAPEAPAIPPSVAAFADEAMKVCPKCGEPEPCPYIHDLDTPESDAAEGWTKKREIPLPVVEPDPKPLERAREVLPGVLEPTCLSVPGCLCVPGCTVNGRCPVHGDSSRPAPPIFPTDVAGNRIPGSVPLAVVPDEVIPPAKPKMLDIHPSSIARALKCPGSIRLDDEVNGSEHGTRATVGTVVHGLIADWLTDWLVPKPWPDSREAIDAIIRKRIEPIGLMSEARTVGWLFWRARLGWEKFVAAIVQEQKAAYAFEGHQLLSIAPYAQINGTTDVLIYLPWTKTLAVLDWKTGVERDASEQLTAYGRLGLKRFPQAERIIIYVGYLRSMPKARILKVGEFTAAELRSWEDRIVSKVVRWDGTFNAGDHCTFCDRQPQCPYWVEMQRQTVRILVPGDKGIRTKAFAKLTPEILGLLWNRRKLVESAAKRLAKYVRTEAEKDDGTREVPLGDGVVAYIRSYPKPYIDPVDALRFLNRYFGADDFRSFLTISKGRLQDAWHALRLSSDPSATRASSDLSLQDELRLVGANKAKETKTLDTRKTTDA